MHYFSLAVLSVLAILSVGLVVILSKVKRAHPMLELHIRKIAAISIGIIGILTLQMLSKN